MRVRYISVLLLALACDRAASAQNRLDEMLIAEMTCAEFSAAIGTGRAEQPSEFIFAYYTGFLHGMGVFGADLDRAARATVDICAKEPGLSASVAAVEGALQALNGRAN